MGNLVSNLLEDVQIWYLKRPKNMLRLFPTGASQTNHPSYRFVLWDDQNWLLTFLTGTVAIKNDVFYLQKNPWDLGFVLLSYSCCLCLLGDWNTWSPWRSPRSMPPETRPWPLRSLRFNRVVVGKAVGGKNSYIDIFMLDIYSVYIYIWLDR